MLDDVVVVAYGTAKKSSFTGSATAVSGEKIAKMQVSSVSKALEGAAAGVQVINTSGQPGENAKIRIRGIGSFSASSAPLYVVDGMPYDEESVNALNPADIESIDVLKDAASAAIYGSAGANGVVLITTKQGREGKAQISFDAYYGIQNVARKANMLNAKEYMAIMDEQALNSGLSAYDWSQYQSIYDANGNVYVDQNGNVTTEKIENSDEWIKLGSVLPKANMAWRNNFSWKNFNAGFMISARLGGVVFSRTQAVLDEFGVSEATAAARDLGYVSVNGGDRVSPESWYSAIGGGDAVAQYYTYSATNVRLQEASIGYTFPRKMFNNVCDLTISLVGRNLWMIYSKAPVDPDTVASTDNFYQGVDYFMMPSTRNFGCSVTLKF